MDSIGIAMAILGHASFALTFLSYAQKSLIKLRMIALASLAVGLAYNAWVNYNMPTGQDIWLVIGWLGLFFLQNLFLLFREIKNTLEVELETQSRALLVAAFPKMHSRDWLELLAAAERKPFKRGDVLLMKGSACDSLCLAAKGSVREDRSDQSRICPPATLFGELTFVMGEGCFNSSPVTITAESEGELLVWRYSELNKVCDRNLRLCEALEHGFVWSAGVKHGLLWCDSTQAEGKTTRSRRSARLAVA